MRAPTLYVVRRRSRRLSGERLRRLMVPPSESAPLSGVWPLMSSRLSSIVPLKLFSMVLRAMPPWPVSWPPSSVMLLRPGPMPRMVNPVYVPPSSGLPAMPGKRMATSAALRLGRLPKESDATTFFTLSALRWAVIAAAAPSRSPVTLKASSL